MRNFDIISTQNIGRLVVGVSVVALVVVVGDVEMDAP